MRVLVVILILMFGLFPACQKDPKTPEDVYRAFYSAVVSGEGSKATGFLSFESKEAMRKMGGKLTLGAETQTDPLPAYVQMGQYNLYQPLLLVEVVQPGDHKVKLKVVAGECESPIQDSSRCSIRYVVMLKQEGRWRISPELPEELTKG
jgi:hypothetical protein